MAASQSLSPLSANDISDVAEVPIKSINFRNAILKQTDRKAFLVFDQSVRLSLSAIENYAQQGLMTTAETPAQLAEASAVHSLGIR